MGRGLQLSRLHLLERDPQSPPEIRERHGNRFFVSIFFCFVLDRRSVCRSWETREGMKSQILTSLLFTLKHLGRKSKYRTQEGVDPSPTLSVRDRLVFLGKCGLQEL